MCPGATLAYDQIFEALHELTRVLVFVCAEIDNTHEFKRAQIPAIINEHVQLSEVLTRQKAVIDLQSFDV